MLTDSLHRVPLLNQELRSGDIDVHAERLLLFVDWLGWTCVFTAGKTEEGQTKVHHAIYYIILHTRNITY